MKTRILTVSNAAAVLLIAALFAALKSCTLNTAPQMPSESSEAIPDYWYSEPMAGVVLEPINEE